MPKLQGRPLRVAMIGLGLAGLMALGGCANVTPYSASAFENARFGGHAPTQGFVFDRGGSGGAFLMPPRGVPVREAVG